MPYEGLHGVVSRGARAGAMVAQGSRALNIREKELSESSMQARAKQMSDMMAEDRKAALEQADMFTKAAVEMRANGMIDTEEYQRTVKGIEASLMGHAVRRQQIAEAAGMAGMPDEMVVGLGGGTFMDDYLPMYQSILEASPTGPEVTTLTPDEVSQFGFPEGSVVQKSSDGGVELVFDPTKKPGALQERVNALMASGADEAMAQGIAAGRFKVVIDPVDRKAYVFDLVEQKRIGEMAPPQDGEGGINLPGLVPDDMQTDQAVGLPGAVNQAMNTVFAMFNADLPNPEAQEAANALQTLQTYTSITMQAEVPGRPSVMLMQKLDQLSVQPNSPFEGAPKARSRLNQTKQVIDNEVARMELMLGQNLVAAKDLPETENNLLQLKQLSRAYDTMISGLEPERGEDTPEWVPDEYTGLWQDATPRFRELLEERYGSQPE